MLIITKYDWANHWTMLLKMASLSHKTFNRGHKLDFIKYTTSLITIALSPTFPIDAFWATFLTDNVRYFPNTDIKMFVDALPIFPNSYHKINLPKDISTIGYQYIILILFNLLFLETL